MYSSVSMSGVGAEVCSRIVYGSTISSSSTTAIFSALSPSEPATVGSRSSVYLTSSASNALPSWNVTPSRSVSSHVTSSTTVQDVASAGVGCRAASDSTSGS